MKRAVLHRYCMTEKKKSHGLTGGPAGPSAPGIPGGPGSP